MLYGDKSIEEIDSYYPVTKKHKKDCLKIQEAFKKRGVYLALVECQDLYKTYSEEQYSVGWNNGIDALNLDIAYDMLKPMLMEIINDEFKRIHQLFGEIKKTEDHDE